MKVVVSTALGLLAQYPLAIMVYNAHHNQLAYPILCAGCEGAFSVLSLLMSLKQTETVSPVVVETSRQRIAKVVGAFFALYFSTVNGAVVYDALKERARWMDLSLLTLVSIANLYLLYTVCRDSAHSLLSSGEDSPERREMLLPWIAGRVVCCVVALLSCGTTGIASNHLPEKVAPYATALAPLSSLLILYKPLTSLWDLLLQRHISKHREETFLLRPTDLARTHESV
ncbi:MAG: hypothetical protein KGR16_06570 [Verrucomicrobia bacterium]|nr:hypothetical protein [Verrucomicrobiota bacterium]